MKKRLTLKDYQDANAQLVEERGVIMVERANEKNRADNAEKELEALKVELLEILGANTGFDGFGERRKATKVQIARRAGELIAMERMYHDMKRVVFEEPIISGEPLPHFHDAAEVKRHIHVDHTHPHADAFQKIVDGLADGIKKEAKRRARRGLIMLAIIIGVVAGIAGGIGAYFF